MKRLFRFFTLPVREKKLHTEALLLVWLVRMSLWLLPFRQVERILSFVVVSALVKEDADWVVIRSVASSIRNSSRYVPYASCLTQALATRTLLRLRGQVSELKIGVDKNEGKFAAHAWLEADGRIIIGRQPEHHRYFVLRPSSSFFV